MTESEYRRERKALLTQWAIYTQNANAKRLLEGVKLNKTTGRPAGRMKGLAKFTLKLKAYRKQPSTIGYATGALKASLQRRSNIIVRKYKGDGEECEILIEDELKTRLDAFESARSWTPTTKEAWWLTFRSVEMAQTTKEAHINFLDAKMKRPARPFYGRTARVDEWLRKALVALKEHFGKDAFRAMVKKANKKRGR